MKYCLELRNSHFEVLFRSAAIKLSLATSQSNLVLEGQVLASPDGCVANTYDVREGFIVLEVLIQLEALRDFLCERKTSYGNKAQSPAGQQFW